MEKLRPKGFSQKQRGNPRCSKVLKRNTSPETLKSIIDFLVWKIGILISHDGKMIKQFDKKLFVSRIKNLNIIRYGQNVLAKSFLKFLLSIW